MKNKAGLEDKSDSEVCCCFKNDRQRTLCLGGILGETIMKKGRKPHVCVWEEA